MFWTILIWIAVTALAYVLAPKPQTQPPPGIGEIKVPTAEEGREIPVLFGTRNIDGPNVVWFGDIKTEPHKIDPCEGGKK